MGRATSGSAKAKFFAPGIAGFAPERIVADPQSAGAPAMMRVDNGKRTRQKTALDREAAANPHPNVLKIPNNQTPH
jgi:hypothetical protein